MFRDLERIRKILFTYLISCTEDKSREKIEKNINVFLDSVKSILDGSSMSDISSENSILIEKELYDEIKKTMLKMDSTKELSSDDSVNDFVNNSIRFYIKRINKFIDD